MILAGGYGSRLAEETDVRPKPMVEVGGRPLLWHIMKSCLGFGLDEFVVALGYKGDMIERYFRDPALVDEPWSVELIDTGEGTNTGGRLGRLVDVLGGDTFMLTYGDGVSDVDLDAVRDFHAAHGRLVTLTAVRPPARFGQVLFDGDDTVRFSEKPQIAAGWINGGFMVMEREALERVASDATSLEWDMLEPLSDEDHVVAYRHEGFWQCMDTLRDLRYLRELWDSGKAPWATW